MVVLMTTLLALDGYPDKPTLVFRDPELPIGIVPNELYGYKFIRIAISTKNTARRKFLDIDLTDVFFAAKFFVHIKFCPP